MERLDPAAVCTLPPDDLEARLAWIRDEILPHARTRERFANGLAWELEAAPGLAEKLDRLVALERACCGGITWQVAEGFEPGRLRLEVRGVDPDAPVFRSSGAAPPTRRARLAKAGVAGVLATLTVCCALPVLAAALVGGAATAGLAVLDDPVVIALGTLAASGAAWWWLGRRARSSCSCGPRC
jgi:hypothetical protein